MGLPWPPAQGLQPYPRTQQRLFCIQRIVSQRIESRDSKRCLYPMFGPGVLPSRSYCRPGQRPHLAGQPVPSEPRGVERTAKGSALHRGSALRPAGLVQPQGQSCLHPLASGAIYWLCSLLLHPCPPTQPYEGSASPAVPSYSRWVSPHSRKPRLLALLGVGVRGLRLGNSRPGGPQQLPSFPPGARGASQTFHPLLKGNLGTGRCRLPALPS